MNLASTDIVIPVELVLEPGQERRSVRLEVSVRYATPAAPVVEAPARTMQLRRKLYDGLPDYPEAEARGVRFSRDLAREYQLAAHRKVGSMSKQEILDQLYPVQTVELMEETGMEEEPTSAFNTGFSKNKPYAVQGPMSRLLHRRRCPKVREGAQGLSPREAREWLGSKPGAALCQRCTPPISLLG